jgi:methionyl-tRNA synthetase
MVTIEDFQQFEFVTATIKSVEDHPNADKLYVLKLDLGNEERQIVAGIKSGYTKEELIGKQIVIIKNLEPAVLRGVQSNGMLLAASNKEGKVVLITTEKKIEDNSKVR